MRNDKCQEPSKAQKDYAVNHLPGAAIDYADDDKVTSAEVKEDVRRLNNNPRTSEKPNPFGNQ